MGLDIVRMRPAHCMRASPDARYALELNGLSYHEEAAMQNCEITAMPRGDTKQILENRACAVGMPQEPPNSAVRTPNQPALDARYTILVVYFNAQMLEEL